MTDQLKPQSEQARQSQVRLAESPTPEPVKATTETPGGQRTEPVTIDENHPDVKRSHELLHGGEPSQRKALAWFEQTITTPEKAVEIIKQHKLTVSDIPKAIGAAQALAGRGQGLSVEAILSEMRQSGTGAVNVSGDPLPTSDAAALVELELREYDLQDQYGTDVMKAWLETFQKDNPSEVERLQQLPPLQQKAQLIALFEHAMMRRPRR